MSKKILILESSVTIQKLFTKTLDGKKYSIKFEVDSKKVFSTLVEFEPDLFLINCDIEKPRSFEIVKILRSLQGFEELPVGMYANIPTTLDQTFAKEAGANLFIKLDQENLAKDVEELAQIEIEPQKKEKISKKETGKKAPDDSLLFSNATELLDRGSYKNVMLSKILRLVENIENPEKMIQEYLLLITEVCEVPLAAIYLMENDGPHGYYVCAEKLDKKDIADFMNVCQTDFEKIQTGGHATKNKPKKLESEEQLESFYSSEIKLSSYEYRVLKTDSLVMGTVHIVSQGNIISERLNYLDFCIEAAKDIFEKALIVEKKIFFEKRIRKAFSRFVPEQIIDSLVMQADKSDEKIGVGETRAVAILFSDIRSFTNISEKNRADVLVAFLNRYFSTW